MPSKPSCRAFAAARRIGLDDVGNCRLAGRIGDLLAGLGQARRTERERGRVRLGARLVKGADMPELRHDRAAGVVDLRHDSRPSGERDAAKKMRNRRIHRRCGVRNDRPLGNNQSHSVLGAAAIICRDIGAGDTTGRKCPGHRRHDDAIGQREIFDGERCEQRSDGSRHRRRFYMTSHRQSMRRRFTISSTRGWQRAAAYYAATFGALTVQATDPLLDTVASRSAPACSTWRAGRAMSLRLRPRAAPRWSAWTSRR